MADVHPGSLEGFQQLLAEQVVSHGAHHGNRRPQTGALQRLIGALSTGGHMEGFAVDRLPGAGDFFRCGDHIHHKAAHNQNARFFM